MAAVNDKTGQTGVFAFITSGNKFNFSRKTGDFKLAGSTVANAGIAATHRRYRKPPPRALRTCLLLLMAPRKRRSPWLTMRSAKLIPRAQRLVRSRAGLSQRYQASKRLPRTCRPLERGSKMQILQLKRRTLRKRRFFSSRVLRCWPRPMRFRRTFWHCFSKG